MKTAKDPRHLKRIKIMQDLFAWDFNHLKKLDTEEAKKIVKHLTKIDGLIAEAAPAWPIAKINKIDLATLRLATSELMNHKKDQSTPPKVIVDEAVEIAKTFGADSSPSFINGVLGKLISLQKIEVEERMKEQS
jgi:transcription antitermination protein NusB